MEVYRLQRARHGNDLSGKGAALRGARWNSTGTEIIYTSASRALAMAELVVHITIATIPDDFLMFTIFIPDDTSIGIIQVRDLPANWNNHPPPSTTQKIGDDFIRDNLQCLLKIPSAVVEGDVNILINPSHPEYRRIRVVDRIPFPFDNRLFKSS